MTKPKRQLEFDQAVEQARLEFLAQHLVEVVPSAQVVKHQGHYYDLEFCLWLQKNFDYLCEYYQQNPGFKLWQGSKA